MKKSVLFAAGAAVLALSAIPAKASTTFDFGLGTNVSSTWPGSSNASATNSGAAVALPNPLLLDGGLLEITGSSTVECQEGVTVGTCADATGLSGADAYGLGVGDHRVDAGESLTVTILGANLTVVLDGFTVTGFGGSSAESFTYQAGSNSAVTVNSPNPNPGSVTIGSINQDFSGSTLVFTGVTNNFSLASLTLDITQNQSSVPEPATFGLAGLAIAGLGFARRRLARR